MSAMTRCLPGPVAVALSLLAAPAWSRVEPPQAPLTLDAVELLVRSGGLPERLRALGQERCIGFRLDDATRARLKSVGANAHHFASLEAACTRLPPPPPLPAPPPQGTPPGTSEPLPARGPFSLFVGGGYLAEAPEDGQWTLHGPSAELGLHHAGGPGFGIRARYLYRLTDADAARGPLSLDLLFGQVSGLYAFAGVRLPLLEGNVTRDEARPLEWSSGLGLGIPLGQHVVLGGELAFSRLGLPGNDSASSEGKVSGVRGGLFLRLFPLGTP